MKHILIIGAGIGGLYTACRLLYLGIYPNNITIIDPRLGRYTRPGHLSQDVFELVQKRTGIDTSEYSRAQHIKELERMLYEALSKKTVGFVTAEFIGLEKASTESPARVTVRKKDGSEVCYDADLIFDCTGRNARVAQAVNQSLEESFFKITQPIDTSGIPTHHMVAQVRMKEPRLADSLYTDANTICKFPKYFDEKPLAERVALIKRLAALGWVFEAFPTFYTFAQDDSDKICLYMEAPPNLHQNQYLDWIQLMIDCHNYGSALSFQELSPSKKYAQKSRISYFENIPYFVEQTVCQLPDLPIVILGFDALKGSDHRLAHGVISGIKLCELMLQYIAVKNGEIIACDTEGITLETQSYIRKKHLSKLETFLLIRRKAIIENRAQFKALHEKPVEANPLASLHRLFAMQEARIRNSPLNRAKYLDESEPPPETFTYLFEKKLP